MPMKEIELDVSLQMTKLFLIQLVPYDNDLIIV